MRLTTRTAVNQFRVRPTCLDAHHCSHITYTNRDDRSGVQLLYPLVCRIAYDSHALAHQPRCLQLSAISMEACGLTCVRMTASTRNSLISCRRSCGKAAHLPWVDSKGIGGGGTTGEAEGNPINPIKGMWARGANRWWCKREIAVDGRRKGTADRVSRHQSD